MISCERSTQLSEKSLAIKLGWLDQKKLTIHNNMCAVCKTYLEQSRLVDSLLAKYLMQHGLDGNSTIINEKLKQRILSKL